MLQKIIIFSIFLLLSVGSTSAVDIIADTRTDIGNIQQAVPGSIPTPPTGYEKKGYVGEVMANIFDATQYIKSEFISAFRNIFNSSVDNVPKWNGQSFLASNLWSVGSGVGVGTSTISSGLTLDIEGKIGATEYCDEDGNSCFQAVSFPAQWYQADNQECSVFCQSRGLTNIADTANSNGKCTSGEVRYTGVTSISYTYGAWGPVGNHAGSSVGGACYYSGQPRDGDATDITVGCFCSGGVQVGSNQVSGSVGGGSSLWTQTGATDIYRDSGKVGIGNNNPQTDLHVTNIGRFDGGIQIDGNVAIEANNRIHIARSNSTDYGGFLVKNNAGDNGAYFGLGNGNDRVTLSLQKADKLWITGGNVGIGVKNPLATLDVNGTIRMRTQTSSGDTADTVATKGYVDSMGGGVSDNLGDHLATQDIDAGNFRIINLAEPTRNKNAATKLYVDTAISTIPNWTNPPVCDGNDKALGWNGSSWKCNTIGAPSGTITYQWITGNWGACTQTGTSGCHKIMGKTRTVQCVNSNGGISLDSNCSSAKPLAIDNNACYNDDSSCGP